MRMRFRTRGLFVVLMCLWGVVSTGYSEVGKSGWTIFKKAQSAEFRGISSVSVANGDFSGVFHNPALLGTKKQRELFFVSESGLADDRLGALVYGHPLRGDSMIAGGAVYYDGGKMDLNWMDNGTLRSESVSAQRDIMGFISYGRRYSNRLYLGGTLKAASSEIAQRESALALAMDLGAVYVPYKNVPVSVSLQNLGTSSAFIEKANPLPTTVYASAGYLHPMENSYVLSSMGAAYNVTDGTVVPEAGFKLGYDFLSMNVGYRFGLKESMWHFGLGVTWNDIEFGYSFAPAVYLNTSHRINVGFRFGGKNPQAAKTLKTPVKPVSRSASVKTTVKTKTAPAPKRTK